MILTGCYPSLLRLRNNLMVGSTGELAARRHADVQLHRLNQCMALLTVSWETSQDQTVNSYMVMMQGEAQRLVGRPFLMSSPQQLAAVLYTDLRLPPPPDRGNR